jgi:hypothetical protein
MAKYILRADVERVIDMIPEQTESHVFGDLNCDITDYRRWVELPRSAEWEHAKTLAKRL